MRIAVIFLSLLSFLAAQEEAHTCRTIFLNGPQGDSGPYYLFDGEVSHKIELPRLYLSPVYELRPGNLELRLLDAPVEDLEDIPEGAPAARVPAGTTDFYLIVTRDPTNEVMPMRLQVINASADRIGRGEMLWFNLTPKAIAGKVGSETLQLGAKKSVLVKEPARDRGGYSVELYFRVPDDDRTHPLIESQWRHDPRTRSIVFVYDEGKRRAPRIMAFSDFRMPKNDK